MRYLLIEIDDTLDDQPVTSLEDIACGLADYLSDDLGVIAQVVCPVDLRVANELLKELS